jgi:hypothetical protein
MFGFKVTPGQPKEPQEQDKKVYPAKPLKGDVNHEAHLESILKRFSKAIAYLGR